ncbi:FecR family protein [Chitinophaga sp. GCM10012297]|uniref:FecR domain-containing protein n=1 Tax=Chitinophaga chungangae TaxID=2821488 RepID=A0ABS3YFW0_9BACT|nr:FecR domain-containing protein [Chitinophaga chungangae]MBO9153567.1 FecR domain-containing protein [Chitinophaga chungangae]
MMNEEQFIELVARKLAGQASPAELAELEGLLCEENLRERYLLLQQYFSAPEGQSSADTELALQKTLERIREPENGLSSIPSSATTPRRRRWPVYAAAAAVSGVIIFFLFAHRQRPQTAAPVAQTLQDRAQWLNRQNGKATRAVIELADGSKIWLNAESKLSYPEVFTRDSREVYLNGEAFFDVAADPERPFIVHLAKGTVKVLGTSFNVRAYDNEPVQTSVTTGKVAFIPKYENGNQRPDTFYITPDQKVTYRHTAEDIIKENTSGQEDKAWTEGRLVFRDALLEDIGHELERSFGKKVVFTAEAPKYYRMTGSFQNNSLQDILFYLARSRPFRYTVTDSTLFIGD